MMVNGGTSSSHSWALDVFLSFRGKDTRRGFTGFLYHALRQKGHNVFIDDKKLSTGEEISPTLLRAIEESRIAVIVFSENYASSTWCLDELVHIFRCSQTRGQIILPVFYKVEPSDVRHQRASFGVAMAKHEARFKNNIEKLQTWKRALFEVANLPGFCKDNGNETELIQEIVKCVSGKLDGRFLYITNFTVGLETRVSEVKSLLHIAPGENICMVGIYGPGGMGKTEIARVLFNLIADQFEHACFLANISHSMEAGGLRGLQKRLIYDLVGGVNIELENVDHGKFFIRERLRGRKVLLILDDINRSEQLEVLTGRGNWFGCGSVIIITTRDLNLLRIHQVDKIYEVKKLNHEDAIELFTWHAFKSKAPDKGFPEISNRLVLHADGHPLALKLMGSYLYGRTLDEWKSEVHNYRNVALRHVQDVLQLSYDQLDDNEKNIFLDIACFFIGETLEYVVKAIGDSTELAIFILTDQSLLYIDEFNKLKMNNLLRDMGREIVRQESPFEPGKRSRLWHHQDILEVLSNNSGNDCIEGMLVDLPDEYTIHLKEAAFLRMTNLRVLIVRNAQFLGSSQLLPENLRLLDWMEYPSSSLSSRKVALFYPPSFRSKPKQLKNTTQKWTVKCCGVQLYQEGMDTHGVTFINPGIHGSNLAYEVVDGAVDISEGENGNDDLEVEELSTSIKSKGYSNNADEMLVNKSNKLVLGSSSCAPSIDDNEKKLQLLRKRKFREDLNIVQVQASASTASASTYRDAVLIESKPNCSEKPERTQFLENGANEEFSQTEDKMDPFSASNETNIKGFREAEKSKNVVCSELANLKARKGELEEQIDGIKAEIADLKLARDEAVQRKRALFENGRMIKVEKDDLNIKIPWLRAEQEGARLTQANIESEWSKLVQQFIEGFSSSPLFASLN